MFDPGSVFASKVRVAVFAKDEAAAVATAAGADIVGGEDLLASIMKGGFVNRKTNYPWQPPLPTRAPAQRSQG